MAAGAINHDRRRSCCSRPPGRCFHPPAAPGPWLHGADKARQRPNTMSLIDATGRTTTGSPPQPFILLQFSVCRQFASTARGRVMSPANCYISIAFRPYKSSQMLAWNAPNITYVIQVSTMNSHNWVQNDDNVICVQNETMHLWRKFLFQPVHTPTQKKI